MASVSYFSSPSQTPFVRQRTRRPPNTATAAAAHPSSTSRVHTVATSAAIGGVVGGELMGRGGGALMRGAVGWVGVAGGGGGQQTTHKPRCRQRPRRRSGTHRCRRREPAGHAPEKKHLKCTSVVAEEPPGPIAAPAPALRSVRGSEHGLSTTREPRKNSPHLPTHARPPTRLPHHPRQRRQIPPLSDTSRQ